jgi:hypothetical protein
MAVNISFVHDEKTFLEETIKKIGFEAAERMSLIFTTFLELFQSRMYELFFCLMMSCAHFCPLGYARECARKV